jgi:hypothetical protein
MEAVIDGVFGIVRLKQILSWGCHIVFKVALMISAAGGHQFYACPQLRCNVADKVRNAKISKKVRVRAPHPTRGDIVF